MTTEGEQQEAVCGTCKGSGEFHYRAPHRFDKLVKTYPNCNSTGRIPAPVVPSDDADCERCAHAGHGEDACEVTVSHGAGVPGMCGCAPPIPLQDAEGDGHWRVIARVVGTGGWRSYERTNADGRVESHRLDESLALAIESAIRAPYEALVREQAETYHGLVCADRLSNWPTRFESCPESSCRKATAALTHIEESLGGRKDG